MTDELSEADVKRVDKHVDPTATSADDIEDALNDDFEGQARDEFAQALADQREAVRNQFANDDPSSESMVEKRLTTNPADGETQLRNQKGQFAAKVEEIQGPAEVVDESGMVAVETEQGTVELGTVDLDAGAAGSRDSKYSR